MMVVKKFDLMLNHLNVESRCDGPVYSWLELPHLHTVPQLRGRKYCTV